MEWFTVLAVHNQLDTDHGKLEMMIGNDISSYVWKNLVGTALRILTTAEYINADLYCAFLLCLSRISCGFIA